MWLQNLHKSAVSDCNDVVAVGSIHLHYDCRQGSSSPAVPNFKGWGLAALVHGQAFGWQARDAFAGAGWLAL